MRGPDGSVFGAEAATAGAHGNVFGLAQPIETEADVAAMTAPVETPAFRGVAHFSVSYKRCNTFRVRREIVPILVFGRRITYLALTAVIDVTAAQLALVVAVNKHAGHSRAIEG